MNEGVLDQELLFCFRLLLRHADTEIPLAGKKLNTRTAETGITTADE